MASKEKITIVGSGLAGPLLAISLKKRGLDVELYERRPDMRKVHISAGRSINLALSTRGIYALREIGVWPQIEKIIIPMRGRMMHALNGALTFQPYGKDETEVINSVSRADLNIALMDAAEAQGITIHFNQRCTHFDLRERAVYFRDEETDERKTVNSELVIGADGAVSAVRRDFLKLQRFNFSQQYLDYGYKELTIPPNSDGKHAMETHALHIWPRGSFMLIALPNIDGTFGCILFLPFEGKNSFQLLQNNSDIVKFFEENFPDAMALMPRLAENFFANPVGAMVTVKCSPWSHGSRALLLGDAAHAIVPFFGQGLNCSFEDCTVLLGLLDRYGPNWPVVFREFGAARKVNTDAIADMAIENFVEMRDKVGDSRFLFKKKVELALEAKFPGLFVPKYAMVTFHRVPYSVAESRGRIQDRILSELCDPIAKIEDLDWQRADELVHRNLTPLEDA
ncbi:monooxygenase, FAD-binding protein [Candidatus Koribacter versatilis Ellin345]|uniref:Kynurenine 3-monooxygenase n=1 Tax=Koribacter versatilis (strain Ellin345) TaxID=204669 RepID=Q1ITW4_KORVE|nr:NAD(P)/FAD-dependent oxidoreductase [Candidatus Koribacter versatilis]ABF39686.1 monooxygenase, FAD-binding protein [Candidatus Koribacter versatilis Ellin345]